MELWEEKQTCRFERSELEIDEPGRSHLSRELGLSISDTGRDLACIALQSV